MANGTVLINGQAYSFTDLKITVLGVELFSCSNIVATENQVKTNNYGSQGKPVSRGRGKKEYEVSLDLQLKDVERIKSLIPGGSLNDMPPTPVKALLDNGTNKHEFTLFAFEFAADGLEMALDDTEARKTYAGICSDIASVKLS